MLELETLLEKADELPSLPEIYIRLSDLLESENSTVHEIGNIVQTDITLTTRILKMVNSAYYGLPNQVTSISQAVSLLGRQQLKQILLGSVLNEVFKDLNIDNFSLLDFWNHSIKTAIIARQLAMQSAAIIDHEAFFTAGLLHDIGRLVLAKVASETVQEIYQQIQSGSRNVVQLEAEKLGVTHIEVGERLMQKWGMPEVLTECVVKHHDQEHTGLYAVETSIVYLANRVSQYELASDEDEMDNILSSIANWQQTQCTMEQVHIACQLADEQWFEVMESLGMVDLEIDNDLD